MREEGRANGIGYSWDVVGLSEFESWICSHLAHFKVSDKVLGQCVELAERPQLRPPSRGVARRLEMARDD